MAIIVKSNIRKIVKELDKDKTISSVSDEVGDALERKVEELIDNAIKRAKLNNRRTLQAKDL
jgi:histone H3/H4